MHFTVSQFNIRISAYPHFPPNHYIVAKYGREIFEAFRALEFKEYFCPVTFTVSQYTVSQYIVPRSCGLKISILLLKILRLQDACYYSGASGICLCFCASYGDSIVATIHIRPIERTI